MRIDSSVTKHLTLLALLLWASATVHAEVDAPLSPRAYTLEELLECAMERHSEIVQGEFKVQAAQARLRQARAAGLLPRLRLKGESGLVPDAEGDIYHPPTDTTGLRSLGPFVRAQLEFVQPLYTFGQLSSLKRAARKGVAVERAGVAEVRVKLAYQIRKRYYAVLLARESTRLLQQLRASIDARLDEVDVEQVLSLADLYKLRLALLQLETQRGHATRQLDLARSALAWQAGFPAHEPLALADSTLEPVHVRMPPLPELIQLAFTSRPDWLQLQAGLAARQAQEEAAHQAYLPQIYLAGGIRYAAAPGRTDQHNPFVVDHYNYLDSGAFIGFRQSFEWGLLGAKVDKARAAYRGLQAKETGALEGLRMDVERARSEYTEADATLETARKARKLGRQWLRESLDEYAFDPDTLDDLVDAFSSYAKLEQDYLEAVYAYNLAVAEVARTTGVIHLRAKP